MSAPAGLLAALHLCVCKGEYKSLILRCSRLVLKIRRLWLNRQDQHVTQPGLAALRRPDPSLLGELGTAQGYLQWGLLRLTKKDKEARTHLSVSQRQRVSRGVVPKHNLCGLCFQILFRLDMTPE